MTRRASQLFSLAAAIAYLTLLMGCGFSPNSNSNNNNNNNNSSAQTGTVNLVLSDASAEDWATIGVRVLKISLIPQGGGTPVVVYTAPNPAPILNLVQLDQLGEILGSASVPVGTYTAAAITIGGNPGDVTLTVAADPEPGFAGTPGQTIPATQIQIQGITGTPGSFTVPVNVNFVTPLVVTANQSNALDIEFDLAHPAFLVEHVPPVGPSIWAVNFNGPLRHHPIVDLARLVLRHIYGNVTAIASDNSSVTITRVFPRVPASNPETPIPTSQSLQIQADSLNGTIFYDLDNKTSGTITNFSSVASTLSRKYVRVAARYQQNGTLVAVRMWASSSFNNVWLSPEGHVLHVNTTTNVITVENEDGTPIALTVDANTKFYFRRPENSLSDATPIAVGTSFVAANNIVRGFKVHANVVDPLATPLVAQSIDIEIAHFNGNISSPTQTGFTCSRFFETPADNYSVNLTYISSSTPNGKDANGNLITGFKWWNFAFPTLLNSGNSAISNFVAATNGSANFGGTVGAVKPWGESYATWNDPAKTNTWSALFTVLVPTPLPRGTVASSWVSNGTSGSFAMSVPNGTNAVTINASGASGSATLVFQVDKTNNIVSISPQDLSSSSGFNNVASHLVNGTPVKVFGVPQSDGSIKAYVIFYYTGTMPI
jgi:Domain of unknown function (DUF4382)